jgi:hypothetical protein
MKITQILVGLSFVLSLSACGNQALEGEYKNQGSGVYSAVEFKGKSTAVVKAMGMTFPTSYERDGRLVRLKTDKSDLLFTIKDDKTLVGQGFAEGVYKKD